MSDPTDEEARNAELLKEQEKYRVGTLQYTKASLAATFGWMIMANLCFNLFEGNGGAGSIPFYLQENFHVSNFTISILFNFIPLMIGTVMTPIVSFKSDRTRTRLGRRIPYILYTAPFLVLFAMALGFSDDIIAYCKSTFSPDSTLGPFTIALVIIGFLTVGWSFFNEFVGTVYYYLLPDVMPRHFLGRFQGASQIAGTLLGIAMNTWVGPHQLTHIKAIHVGVSILYFVGFGLVCWRVKEGQYPPVEDVSEKTTFLDKAKLYFKECFHHPIYVMIYMVSVVTVLTRGLNPSGIFALHLSQHQSAILAHDEVNESVAMTPGREWMVSGGQDGLIKVWKSPARSFEATKALSRQGGAVQCLTLDQTGDLVAFAVTNGSIEVWDVANDQRLQTLTGHTGTVTCLAFPGDGARLASAGSDHTVRIWDVRSAACSKILPIDKDILALALTPDGQWLAAGVASNTLQCLDLANGKPAKTFTSCMDCANGVSLSDNGRTVALCSGAGAIEVWNVADTPELRHQIKPEGKARALSLSANGKDLFLCFDRSVATLDVASGKSIGTLDIETNAPSLAMAPGGGQLVSSDSNGVLTLWERPDKIFKQVKILSRHGPAIQCLAIDRQGDRMAVGSTNGMVEVWDIARDECLRRLSAHKGAVTSVALPGDGTRVASAGSDRVIKVWDVRQGECLSTQPAKEDILALAMTPDAKWLASGSAQRTLHCWDLASGKAVGTFTSKGQRMGALAISADGKTLASCSRDGPVEVWDLADDARIAHNWWDGIVRVATFDMAGKQRLKRFSFAGDVKDLALSSNGDEVSACSDRNVKCWATDSGRMIDALTVQTASMAIAMTPDGKTVVSGGRDGAVKAWDCTDPKKPKLLRSFDTQGMTPLAVACSPDGRAIAAGLSGGTVKIWSTANGECLHSLTGHAAFVRCVAFSKDGTKLASASADSTVKLWEVDSGTCLQTLAGHKEEVNCAAFSSDGNRIVSGGSDKKIMIWDARQGTRLGTIEGSPGPVYAVCFAPELAPVPEAEQVKLTPLAGAWDFVKNVFVNESLFAESQDQLSRIRGEDRWVISGGRDGDNDEVNSGVRIWDVNTRRLIPAVEELKTKALKGHKGAIYSVAYKPDLRVIMSGSSDESIRIWKPMDISKTITRKADDQSFKTINGYTRGVTGFACQNAGAAVVNASQNGVLHVWDIDQGVSLDKASRYAGNFNLILMLIIVYPLGALVDRVNPIRIVLWTTFLGLPTTLLYYFFYHDYTSGLVFNLIMMPINTLGGLAALPMMVMLYPKTKYGQFSSANAMVKQFVGAFAGMIGALLMDHFTAGSYDTDNYRYGYFIKFFFNCASFACLLGVYFYWKKLGGEKYSAPEHQHS